MKKALLNGAVIVVMMLSFWSAATARITTREDKSVNTVVAACSGKQLALKEVEGESDIGGKRYGNYVFTNISSSPCRLSGFPNFILLNKSGQIIPNVKIKYENNFVIGNTGAQINGNKPSRVTIEPKQTAWFQIFYNDGMALDHKRPFPISAMIKVKAPNTKRYFVIKSKIQECCGISVSSIRKGLPQ